MRDHILPWQTMFHSWDSPRLLVCDTGLYLEQNDISFITVAICGGYISKYPRLYWLHCFSNKTANPTSPEENLRVFTLNCTSMVNIDKIDLLVGITMDDDVIKRQHFPRYWPFVRGIQRSPVNSPNKSQWRGALVFSLICAWIYKRLSKQSWGWWFETPSRSLWRHSNVAWVAVLDLDISQTTNISDRYRFDIDPTRKPMSNRCRSEGICYLG